MENFNKRTHHRSKFLMVKEKAEAEDRLRRIMQCCLNLHDISKSQLELLCEFNHLDPTQIADSARFLHSNLEWYRDNARYSYYSEEQE
jgi:hypothetical protein